MMQTWKKNKWWVPPVKKLLERDQLVVREKLNRWRNFETGWRFLFLFSFLFPLFGVLLFVVGIISILRVTSLEGPTAVIYFIHPIFWPIYVGIIGFCIAVFSIYKKMRQAEKDIIKLIIAESKGWEYDPSESSERWHDVYLDFDEVFRSGNTQRYVHDQFWGNIDGVHFWAGDFHSVYKSNYFYFDTHEKRERHFFAIKIPSLVQGELHLKSENFFSKIHHKWFNRDIDVESIDFNRVFRVMYRGDKMTAQQAKLHLISPGLQHRLIEANIHFGDFDVLVKKNMVICMFNEPMINKPITNFLLHGFHVFEEDVETLESKMTLLLRIMSELKTCVR